ncbi:unnamed protein product [Cylindrotheca closterium]|uniref:gamma-glutamylcyclotransferase n=1 Tax=Cylindrotheca closterium TaxID=2856 RepID=A0AAD2FLP9_9STRA|nr:unnamed protein product [Cylindrotheca closterium]
MSTISVLLIILILVNMTFFGSALSSSSSSSKKNKTYRYFGYGSNVLVSTMKALRQIQPLDATAAVLPDYELRFDGSESSRLVEPSAAFVNAATGKQVHGVLYTLSAEDFAKVGRTEGVPFAYRWQKCQVYPYVGNGKEAGKEAMESANDAAAASSSQRTTDTYVLISPNLGERNIPPSSSYLGLIKEGAAKWKFDQAYQEELASIEEAKNLIIPQGLSGLLLKVAEAATGTKRE